MLYWRHMEQFQPDDIKKNAVWAAMSYVLILSLVVLFGKKDSPFAQAHAKQGVILLVIFMVINFIPVLSGVLDLLVAIVSVTAMIKAARGEFWEIPVVSELVSKIPWTS